MNRFSKAAATVSFYCLLMLLSPISEASTINYTFFGVTNSSELAGEVFSPLFSYDNLTLSNPGEASNRTSGLNSNFNNPTFDLYTALKESNGISTSTANFFDGLFTGLIYGSDIVTGRPTLSRITDNQSSLSYSNKKQTYNQTVTKNPGGGSSKNNGGSSGGGGAYTYTTSNPVNFSVVVPSSIPIPAAIWLFGTGLAGFGMISCRKRQLAL
ncbi:hypothetical protein [Methylobacter psychrophilus]|uniref:hypothetical protein n=1 Tax=Methylobacter psychrophilus TaxID=96941 RepID=UPI0021D48B95|nr:hypothetical protein [Methylobacter psychrophilus]